MNDEWLNDQLVLEQTFFFEQLEQTFFKQINKMINEMINECDIEMESLNKKTVLRDKELHFLCMRWNGNLLKRQNAWTSDTFSTHFRKQKLGK